MNLTEQINNDIKTAMLAKDAAKLAALRAVKSELLLEASKGGNSEISEETGQKLVQKLVKQRKDALEIYLEQKRQDLADVEQFQIDVLSNYLPKQMDEAEVRKVIQEVIAQTGASSAADMGKVMGASMGKLSGKADGKLISAIVKEELSK
ncbi:MAG: GatB/YqeY domain-containing protein [Flavobacteriales bacterium]|nr:GatB/YqeY domain-containing protein [Flavobacteriales bacterium]MCB9173105.1 GatB/YqeY domain-containing protein [Flavobacteriales bacterium]